MQKFLLFCQHLPKLTFIFQTMRLAGPDLRSVLCEGTDLDQYVQFNSQAEKQAFQDVSCSLTPQQLINAQRVLLQNLDPRKVVSSFYPGPHTQKHSFYKNKMRRIALLIETKAVQ